uniref:Uncharacterized protein n=1 Tax=Arundo donax TaxID=35708 RepID=A0A0A9EX44_ARUDO
MRCTQRRHQRNKQTNRYQGTLHTRLDQSSKQAGKQNCKSTTQAPKRVLRFGLLHVLTP